MLICITNVIYKRGKGRHRAEGNVLSYAIRKCNLSHFSARVYSTVWLTWGSASSVGAKKNPPATPTAYRNPRSLASQSGEKLIWQVGLSAAL